jgi:hypothetical protein
VAASDDVPAARLIDHRFVYTRFANLPGRTKDEIHSSLRGLERTVRQARGTNRPDLPLLKLAKFGERRSSGGSLRHDANMLEITGIELDYDAGDLPWDHAWGRLYQSGLAALLYTTPSHSQEKPRFRVLLCTSRPLPVAQRATLVARAYGVLKGTIDPASFTASQSYFYGRVERGGHPVRTQLVESPNARFIDQADDLDAGALGPDGKPYRDRPEVADHAPADSDCGDVQRKRGVLAYVPGAEYVDWLRTGMALYHQYDGSEQGFELWDEWSLEKSEGNYDAASQRTKWQSFSADRAESRVTFGSLVHIARQNGWTPDILDSLDATLRLLSTYECEFATPPAYIWKWMLGERQMGCIFGAPGAGKSLLAPYIALMVALGQPAFGMRTRQGSVFYVVAEDATGMRQRIAALAGRHGHTGAFQLVDGVSDLFGDESLHLAAFVDLVEMHRPALIVIDTLAAAFPGLEENDAKSMGQVVRVARRLTEQGAAVILVHHDTKAEGATPRGHSILNGALDMTLHVKRDGGIIRCTLRKNRSGTTDRDIAFQIGIEELGQDSDGDAITAAVLEELAGAGAPRQTPLPKSQRAALAVFAALETDGPVTDDEWMAACVEGTSVSPAADRKSRQTAFRRARQALVNANVLSIDQLGFVTRSEIISGY